MGYTILLILSLFLVSTNLRAAITSISPLLEDIQKDLGMNGMSASLLTTIPLFCMGIFAPMAASLSDRLGMERAITVCIGLIGIATAARFFASPPSCSCLPHCLPVSGLRLPVR
ncbi:MFS transporter [Paenibacillus sp. cl6col]